MRFWSNESRGDDAGSLLASRLAAMSPRAVVVVLKGTARHVEQAVKRASLAGVPMYALPFPAMGHQGRYVDGLAEALRELQATGSRAVPARRA